MGTPTKYTPEYCDKAREVCKSGTTNQQLADALGVGKTTIDRWLVKYPEFRAAVEAGRGVADKRVEFSLYERAIGGYSYAERKEHRNAKGEITRVETIHKHLAPDTLAMIFWLKNRRPDLWRDKHEQVIENKGATPEMTDHEKMARINEIMARARRQRDYEKGMVTAPDHKGNGNGSEKLVN